MPLNLETFRKNLTYTTVSAIPAIRQDLQQLQALDQKIEAQKAQYEKLLFVAIGVMVVAIILTALSLVVLGVPLLLLAIPAIVTLLVLINRVGRLNLENARYELARTLLTMVERDLPAGQPLHLTIDFAPATDQRKKQETIAHPLRSGWKIDRFVDSWFNLQGRFADGTKFALEIRTLNQTAYGWKRGRSGKNKYKTKTKAKGIEVSLWLKFSTRKYGAIKLLRSDAFKAVKVPGGVTVKQFQLADQELVLLTKAPPDTSPNLQLVYRTVTMMFLSLYQILNLARTLSKPKQA